MKQVLLVRHAESENNASHARLAAQPPGASDDRDARIERARVPDPGLSAVGWEQARLLAGVLAGRMQDRRPLLVTSPMRRALCTAAEVATALSLGRDQVWCHGEAYEVGGSYYGNTARPTTTAPEIEAAFPVTCHHLPPEGWYAGRAGRETSDEARARVDRMIAWMEQLLGRRDLDYDTVIVVTHGELMTRWLRRWLGIPWHTPVAFIHANTGITALSWDARRGVLVDAVNDVRHLPERLRTDLQGEWWRYVLPDVEIDRHVGAVSVPPPLAAQVAALRQEHLLAAEGKTMETYRENDARNVHFIARAEGRLAGYVQYDPALNRLRQLVVVPSRRGARLGLLLVERVKAEARQRGNQALLVHAWTRSLGFYRRAGFEPLGEPEAAAPVPWQRMALALD